MIEKERFSVNNQTMMLSNLSFDHSLSSKEFYDLQNLLFSPVVLSQIYFKDNIDLESIEKVKLLLEGLPNINDSMVEKFVMKDVTEEEKHQLMNMNFFNIDTWNISYSKDNNKYCMTSLTKYRKMEEWYKEVLHETTNDGFSLMDKVCYLYDRVKMFEFVDDCKYDRIPEAICEGKASSLGYNLVFRELLMKCGIRSIVEKVSDKEEENYVTLAIINDDKYNINGVYVFDPSMDTIYKDQYKNNLARKMNYNFFGITVDKLKSAYPKRKMCGIMKILSSDDVMEFNHFTDLFKSKGMVKEIEQIEKDLGIAFNDVFSMIISTKEISKEVRMTILVKTLEKYPQEIFNREVLTRAISDNYSVRNDEMFTNKSVKKMSKIDTNK